MHRTSCVAALQGSLLRPPPPRGPLAGREADFRLELAARNHADQSVYSGTDAGIASLEATCADRGLETRRLAVSHPFHSAAMDPMLEAFRQVVASVPRRQPVLPWFSALDGELVAERALGTDFWVDQLRRPVRFVDALNALSEHAIFCELGPQPVLCAAGARTLPQGRFVPTLDRDRQDPAAVHQTAASLWAQGARVQPAPRPRQPRYGLPAMPFARERHWIEPDDSPPLPTLEVRAWEPRPKKTVFSLQFLSLDILKPFHKNP